MFKNKDKSKEQEIPDGGTLPGEQQPLPDLEFGGFQEDSSVFVKLSEPGDTFTGKFIRKVSDNDPSADLKYPGLLFAEYPSGNLKVIPPNYNLAEKVAEVEEHGCGSSVGPIPIEKAVWQITLAEVKTDKAGKSVKLFRYGFAPCPTAFMPKWNDRFTEGGK